jgi:hypothetical protein
VGTACYPFKGMVSDAEANQIFVNSEPRPFLLSNTRDTPRQVTALSGTRRNSARGISETGRIELLTAMSRSSSCSNPGETGGRNRPEIGQ